jgi:hypothetical protein
MVDRLVVLGGGAGNGGGSVIKALIGANEQVRAATGVDMAGTASMMALGAKSGAAE